MPVRSIVHVTQLRLYWVDPGSLSGYQMTWKRVLTHREEGGCVTRPSRKTRFSRKAVRLSRKISLSQKKSEGVSYDIAGKLYISRKNTDLLIFLRHSQKTRTHLFPRSKWKWTVTYVSCPFGEKVRKSVLFVVVFWSKIQVTARRMTHDNQ